MINHTAYFKYTAYLVVVSRSIIPHDLKVHTPAPIIRHYDITPLCTERPVSSTNYIMVSKLGSYHAFLQDKGNHNSYYIALFL